LSISDHMCQRGGGLLFSVERVEGGGSSFQTNAKYFEEVTVKRTSFAQKRMKIDLTIHLELF
jgi:hypothetical protein